MRIPSRQVDAFTGRVFGGNPAAVCPLEAWLDAELMQAIALENNLSETAFLVPRAGGTDEWELRWFTPTVEVDLCGHATLAAAHVVFEELRPGTERVRFHSQSGPLSVEREGELLVLDFPADPCEPAPSDPAWTAALGAEPLEVWRTRGHLVLFESEAQLRALRPDFAAISALGTYAVIATAPGEEVDFVSRFFAPAQGVDEDPVTGSAHCALTPFWSQRLGKRELRARQISARGGELFCTEAGERVRIAGRAVDERAVTLGAASLLRVRPGAVLSLAPAEPGSEALVWSADSSWAEALLGSHHTQNLPESEAGGATRGPCVEPADSSLAEEAAQLLRDAWLDRPVDGQAGLGAARRNLRLLEILFARPSKAERSAARRQGDLIRILAQSDPCEPDWSLRRIAQRLGVSERHASRLFRTELGVSFRTYTQRGRVERAKKLLATTNDPVAEIGVRAGWGATSQFHAAFRSATGMTPRRTGAPIEAPAGGGSGPRTRKGPSG